MKHPICIWYHTLAYLNGELLPNALHIMWEQWQAAIIAGLTKAATEIHIGVNGGDESDAYVWMMCPYRARLHMHGLQCHTENRTVLAMEEWAREHPGWHVLYFHAKGATRPEGDVFSATWRACMIRHCITNWRRCVEDLEAGYEAVGCHYMEPPETPEGQYIFVGTHYWTTSDFLATLPLITERDRIKQSGLDAKESRYEAEVILGNGPRIPRVKDYHSGWNPSKWQSCKI